MYLTAYQLYEPIKEIISTGEPVTILLSLIILAAEAIMSPMLISKYSSWLLLGIGVTSEHDSKTDWILPCVLIVVNMLWAVHSFDRDVKCSAVDRGYTDYSKEYLAQEAQKIDYAL